MNQTSPLDKDLIAQPELWKLRLFLSANNFWVALVPPIESESLIVRSYVIDQDAPAPQKAIESILYANPLLFSDFKSVLCYVASHSQLAVPPQTPPGIYSVLMEEAFPSNEEEIIATPLGDDMPVMLTSINSALKGFLSRTFYNITFASHFLPLCNLVRCQSISSPQIAAFIMPDSLDVLAMSSSNLLLANSFATSSPETAAYYLLASRKTLGLGNSSLPILTAGHQSSLASLNANIEKTGVTIRPLTLPQFPFLLPQQPFPLQLL